MSLVRQSAVVALVAIALTVILLLLGPGIAEGDSIPAPSTSSPEISTASTGTEDPDRSAAGTTRWEVVVASDGPAGSAVVLDGMDGEPIPGLGVDGRDESGRRLSVESDLHGIIVLPAGSWQLETPSKHYRLEGDLTVVDPGETGVVLWATRVPSARLRVVSVGGQPVGQARITVLASPLPEHYLRRTFVTGEDGFITDEEGFEELRPEGLPISISHHRFDLKDLVLHRTVGDDVHEVFLHPSPQAPRVITCVDQAGVPIEGVLVHASRARRRFQLNRMHLGTTDAAGQLPLPAWATGPDVTLIFDGAASGAIIEPRDACEVYRLFRACSVVLQVLDWEPDMGVSWLWKIIEPPEPDECRAKACVETLVHQGGGRFEASFPMGLSVEMICWDNRLWEWNAVVTPRTPGRTIDVQLEPPAEARRMTLAPKGGTIDEVRITTSRLYSMAAALSRRGDEVSFMMPTDGGTLGVCSTEGEYVMLGGKAGDQDVTTTVTFKGTHRVDFAVVDENGQPIPDVMLYIGEASRTSVSSEWKDGWKQKDYRGRRSRVQLTKAGTASVDLVPGSYVVKIRPLPWRWRHCLPHEWTPHEGRTFRVMPNGNGLDVRVATERPRCLTFELVANSHADIPQVWSLRNASSGESRECHGRFCKIWTTERGRKWEIRSGSSLLGSVEVPEWPWTWSGKVRIE